MAHFWDARSWKAEESLGLPDGVASPFWFGGDGAPESIDKDASLEKFLYVKGTEKGAELRGLRRREISSDLWKRLPSKSRRRGRPRRPRPTT